MRVVLFVLFVLFTSSNYSQDVKQDSIYNKVNIMPEYPDGGANGFSKYIAQNFRTSKIKHSVNGTLYMQFIVEPDGTISDIKCIKDLGYGTCEEATRIIKKSKKWIPGTLYGKKVRVTYTLPIKLDITSKYFH